MNAVLYFTNTTMRKWCICVALDATVERVSAPKSALEIELCWFRTCISHWMYMQILLHRVASKWIINIHVKSRPINGQQIYGSLQFAFDATSIDYWKYLKRLMTIYLLANIIRCYLVIIAFHSWYLVRDKLVCHIVARE